MQFRDRETNRLKVTRQITQGLAKAISDGFVGIATAFDGPTGTHWIFEINENQMIVSITATTGFDQTDTIAFRTRPEAYLDD